MLRREQRLSRELLLDVNELVGESGYVELGLWEVSPDTSLMAYSVDFDGDEVYELRFRDLASGADLRRRRAAPPLPAAPGRPTRRTSSTSCTTTCGAQHQVWRHRIGTPADRGRAGAGGPGRAVRARGLHTSRTGELVVIWSENRDTSEVWVLDAAAPDLGAALGGRSPPRGGVPRRARAPRRRLRRAAARDQRRRHRVPAGALPGAARGRPGRVGVGAGAARGPRRAARAGRRLRRTRRAHLAGRRPQPAAHPAARRPHRRGHRRPAGLGHRVARRARHPQRRARRGPDHRGRRVLPDAAGLVRARPGHGGAHRAAAQGGAGLRPVGVRRRAAVLPVGRRHPRAGHDPAAPWTRRWTARRRACSTPTAPTSRSTRTRSGTRRSRRCSTAAWSTCTRTSAAAARAAAAGGSTAGWSTSSTPSTTTSRWPTASRRPAWSTARGSRPAASPPAGCSRARCSPSGPTAGAPWSPRSRSSTC